MNLVRFLKKVDELADSCEKKHLAVFIHEMARLFEEEKREEFLERLARAASGAIKEYNVEDDKLAEEYGSVSEALKKIEEGELVLYEEYNDEYDDWYNSMAEEFLYTDSDGIQDILEAACSFVHKCVDQCMFADGADIGERLFALEIQLDSEYDMGVFTLEDLRYHQLLDADLSSAALDALYCIYHSCPIEKRPEEIYDLICNAGLKELGIESLMQHGDEELPEFDTFLDAWIRFLSDKTGAISNRLFQEALSLKDDFAFSVEAARSCAGTHPELYLKLLEPNSDASEETMLDLGVEALDLIDRASSVRGEVALMTADFAVRSGKPDIAEMCYVESFRSSLEPIHYLRALLNSRNAGETPRELDQIWEETPKATWSCSDLYAIEFLTRNFVKVLTAKRGMGMQTALGWSGSFMKQCFAIYNGRIRQRFGERRGG